MMTTQLFNNMQNSLKLNITLMWVKACTNKQLDIKKLDISHELGPSCSSHSPSEGSFMFSLDWVFNTAF